MISSPSYHAITDNLFLFMVTSTMIFLFSFFLLLSFPLSLSLFLFLSLFSPSHIFHSKKRPFTCVIHYRDRAPVSQKVNGKPRRFQNNMSIYAIYRGYIFIGSLHRFVAIKAQKLGRERKGESSKRGGGKRKSNEEMEKEEKREEKRAMKKREKRERGNRRLRREG